MTTFGIGQEVIVNPNAGFPQHCLGVVYKITKVPAASNQVNYVAKPANGVGTGVKGRADAFLPYDSSTGTDPRTVAQQAVVYAPEAGSIVKITGVAKINPNDLYVVTADKVTTARVVKVGGEGGRYWPSIPASKLTVVQVQEVPTDG